MSITADSKVFLVPRDIKNYEVISVTIRNSPKTLVLAHENIYEVREVGPASSFDSRPDPKFPSGEPVKSFIFEDVNGKHGYIKQNASILSLTKYDLLFPVLCSLSMDTEELGRYKSKEDLLDEVISDLGSQSSHNTMQKHIFSSFEKICEIISENGEEFYRVNISKVVTLLDVKIQNLKNLLLKNKTFALSANIEESLGGVETEPSVEVLELQTLRYSIDYIFDSYLTPKHKLIYCEHIMVDFTSLDKFILDRERQQKARAVVEQNSLAAAGSKNNTGKQTKQTKQMMKKKAPVKVAVGKGALDSFFARKA